MHGQCLRLVVEETIRGERGAKVDEEVAHGAEQWAHSHRIQITQLRDMAKSIRYTIFQGFRIYFHNFAKSCKEQDNNTINI